MDVLSVGQASVAGSNRVRAKDEALNQALRRGVQTYLIRQFGPNAMKENFVRIMGELLPQVLGDVENYHILAESRIGDELNLLVRVGINEGRVREKIVRAGLSPMDGPPLKVLFMVADPGRPSGFILVGRPGPPSHDGPSGFDPAQCFSGTGVSAHKPDPRRGRVVALIREQGR